MIIVMSAQYVHTYRHINKPLSQQATTSRTRAELQSKICHAWWVYRWLNTRYNGFVVLMTLILNFIEYVQYISYIS